MAKRTFHLSEEEKNAFRQREAVSRDATELKRLQAQGTPGTSGDCW
jgi:hypothetical protein